MKKTPEHSEDKPRNGLRLVKNEEPAAEPTDKVDPSQSKTPFVQYMNSYADAIDAEIQKILDL